MQPKLPTGPQQLCQDHELPDGAQPICEAARHVQKARKKKVRGVSDGERHAAPALTNEAPVGADYGVAMRTGMRDDGQ